MYNHKQTMRQLKVVRDILNGIKTKDHGIQGKIIDAYLVNLGLGEMKLSDSVDYICGHLKPFMQFATEYDISSLKPAEIKPVEKAEPAVPGFSCPPYEIQGWDNLPFGYK